MRTIATVAMLTFAGAAVAQDDAMTWQDAVAELAAENAGRDMREPSQEQRGR